MKTQADYEKVIHLVDKVLEENFIVSPPVNVAEVAGNYGLTIFETVFGGNNLVSGLIDTSERKIFVNENDAEVRKAFTIAHELGHWLMHKAELKENPDEYAIMFRIPMGEGNDDCIEQEANFFAANLLVPSKFLDEFFRQKKYDAVSLAEIFGVSQEVIGYRLKNEYGSRVVL